MYFFSILDVKVLCIIINQITQKLPKSNSHNIMKQRLSISANLFSPILLQHKLEILFTAKTNSLQIFALWSKARLTAGAGGSKVKFSVSFQCKCRPIPWRMHPRILLVVLLLFTLVGNIAPCLAAVWSYGVSMVSSLTTSTSNNNNNNNNNNNGWWRGQACFRQNSSFW